jgi:hypothetical protein
MVSIQKFPILDIDYAINAALRKLHEHIRNDHPVIMTPKIDCQSCKTYSKRLNILYQKKIMDIPGWNDA